jgi:hypothetical protein
LEREEKPAQNHSSQPLLNAVKLTLSKIFIRNLTLPTVAQCLACTEVCQKLTGFYISVDLVIIDERTNNLVILAGEEIQIEIALDGNWEFAE